MTDDAASESPKRKAPITLLKERAEAAEARVRELEAGQKPVVGVLTQAGVFTTLKRREPVDIAVFYKDLICSLVTHDPGAMTHEVLPGKKKNAVLAYLAYADLVERHDEFAAMMAAENVQRDQKDKKEQEAVAKEQREREARRAANVARKGQVGVVKNVRSPEEAFLADVQRQNKALSGPMPADQD